MLPQPIPPDARECMLCENISLTVCCECGYPICYSCLQRGTGEVEICQVCWSCEQPGAYAVTETPSPSPEPEAWSVYYEAKSVVSDSYSREAWNAAMQRAHMDISMLGQAVSETSSGHVSYSGVDDIELSDLIFS